MLRLALLLSLVAGAPRMQVSSVPLAAMTETNRALAASVVEHCTLRRDYPRKTFRGRLEHFEFLMDNIVTSSVLCESLGLIQYRAIEVSPGRAYADDRAGAQGYLQQVYCGEGKRVYYVEGLQRGSLQARGRGIVVVTYTPTGPEKIEYTGRMYVRIDNRVTATLAQVFFLFVKGTVDRHFREVIAMPIYLSGLAVDDPGGLRRCIEGLPLEDYVALNPLLDLLSAGPAPVKR